MLAPIEPRLARPRTIPRWSVCLLTGVTLLSSCGQHSDDGQHANSGGRSGNGAGAAAGRSGATQGGTSGASGSAASGASSEAGSPDSSGGGNGCATVGVAPSPDDPTDTPAPDQALGAQTHSFFKITVKDSASGAAIPGAQLSTVNSIVYTSDANGVVAFYEPGMMGLTVFFSVSHPGFQAAADGFGVRGKALLASEGGSAEILLDKTTGSAVPVSSDLATRLAAQPVPRRSDCFAIRLFDQDNLRGVPLARLSAFGEDYWSDSQGMIAYCNPDHLGTEISFDFFSHGYALATGTTTVELSADRGGAGALKLRRTNIAERLYRLTGGGIYRDSVLLGLKTPLGSPTLAGQVLGQDTASTALYKGQLFWVWGDTNRVSYVLGNFHGTSATSLLPAAGGLSPDRGVDLHYFVGADGFAAPMCTDCPGGPAWFAALVSVPDANQDEKLFAGYGIANSDLTFKETGLAELDDTSLTFERVITDFKDRPNFTRPDGHPFKLRHGQQTYVYYGALRIPASADAFLDPSRYEQFTPYGPAGSSALEYGADGHLSYAYRAGGLTPDSAQLNSAGVPASQDPSGHDLSVADGSPLNFTPRAVTWNAYRKRFVGTAQQIGGSSSYIGEIWHSEADTPVGPWVYAQKIISHDNYTFYNTFHHPEFDRDRFLYLEGTYTASFANYPTPTPRYDYNQILYRVDLEDPRLVLPVAIYDLGDALPGDFVTKLGLTPGADPIQPVFLATDRPLENSVAVAWSGPACQTGRTLVVGNAPPSAPLFYALPPDLAPPPPHTVPLYDYVSADGLHAYSLSDDRVPAGFTRAPSPIALVAENPIALKFPVADYLGDLIARAGGDQCLSANPGGTSVLLDASASLSSGGKIVHYFWHLPPGGACESVEGERVTVKLPPGLFSIELEIQDDAGNDSRDTLLVSIQ